MMGDMRKKNHRDQMALGKSWRLKRCQSNREGETYELSII